MTTVDYRHPEARRSPFILIALCTLTVALWLGSLVHLMLSVATLFSKFPRLTSNVAYEGAPVLFHVSERYHLGLAVVAIVATVIWQRTTRSRVLLWASGVLLLAGLLATMQVGLVTPRMSEAQRVEDRPTFNRLHRVSNVQYVAQTVLVFTAALLLPAAIRQPASRDRAPEALPG